ncbi:MAG TPA: hypothetical protein VMW38_22620 [Terriglobia bacterium]|nr:hypothetical protein [Terriglobia bacterium]
MDKSVESFLRVGYALRTRCIWIVVIFLLCLIAVVPVRAQIEEVDLPEQSVDWKGLFYNSSFYLGIMHGFRLATEAGTREGLSGPFWPDYIHTLGNLHGWSDGDEFMVNYIGHPIQGAVSGFMFVEYDRKYRTVEFGKRPAYWKSRLRGAAWAWAFSEQFEIGPVSEASIGNIQALYPAQGFVDHVITPSVGLGWMVAEDVLDKYVVEYVESRTRNLMVRRLVRTWLNPSRGFANLMAFRTPWTRDSRPAVDEYDPKAWKVARSKTASSTNSAGVAGDTFLAQPSDQAGMARIGGPNITIPAFELAVHYDYFHHSQSGSSSGSCNGGGATGTFFMNRWLGAVIDISGCKMSEPDTNLSGDSLTYLFGPRFMYRSPNRLSLYLDLKIGGNKITQERVFPDRIPTGDLTEWNALPAYDRHALYTQSTEANGFAVAVGGGMDIALNRMLAFRVGNLEYLHTTIGDYALGNYSNMLRFSTGLILRTGTW